MQTNAILDILLKSGREVVDQAKDLGGRAINLSSQGVAQGSTASTLGKGALIGGVMGLMLGTRAGRRIGMSALKLGTVAAVGAIGYRVYQNWQAHQSGTETNVGTVGATTAEASDPGEFLHQLKGADADARGLRLVRAMIGAANADGHIDDTERRRIDEELTKLNLPEGAGEILRRELNNPVPPRDLAVGVTSLPEKIETYVASAYVIDIDDPRERAYLDDLGDALGLDRQLMTSIEHETNV